MEPMAQSRNISVDEYLDHALQSAGAQAAQMRKTLESPQGKLLVAIKQVSGMLSELSTDKLPPRSYYEIYNVCFDALSQLQEYLLEDHKNHHLADVYEIVEYTGNVLPRLYLMITVGAAFMATGDAPRQEVLKDMLEMSRGIQNPLRGLFLRFYLGQRTGAVLAESTKADLEFSVAFTLTNFVEMNKLWVRYQHQGHSRNYDQRTKERIQLQTVVGSSILRLSQLDAIDITVFREQILPAVLDQVIECRDKLAQEYLLDIIVQAFPIEFHLESLNLFLESIEFLNPEASASSILLSSMNRTIEYAKVKSEEFKTQELHDNEHNKLVQKTKDVSLDKDKYSAKRESVDNEHKNLSIEKQDDIGQPSHSDDDKNVSTSNPESVNEKTGTQDSTETNKEQNETEKAKSTSDVSSTASNSEEAIEKVTGSNTVEQNEPSIITTSTATATITATTNESKEHDNRPVTIQGHAQKLAAFFKDTIEKYWVCVQRLKLDSPSRAKVVQALLELLTVTNNTLPLSDLFKVAAADGNKIEQSKEMENLLLSLFSYEHDQQIIMDLFKEFPGILPSQSKATRHAIAERIIQQVLQNSAEVSSVSQTRQVLELFSVLLRSGGFEAAKITQFIRLLRGDSVRSSIELLELAHRTMREGGKSIVQQTSGVIVNATLLLLLQSPGASDVAHILKFVNRICHELSVFGDSPVAAYRLQIDGARAADSAGAEEAAYEFFAQALSTYEESITDSHQQVVALAIAIHALQQVTVFTTENYMPLAQRCNQYSQRLLKKQDQCRSLLLASHLYWDNDYSDSRAVEDTLNRALRSADSVMDVSTSIDLFLDVLETNLYFLANETMTISVSRVNSLLKLINENMQSAQGDPDGSAESEGTPSLAELESRLKRIRQFVKSQIQAFPMFEEISF